MCVYIYKIETQHTHRRVQESPHNNRITTRPCNDKETERKQCNCAQTAQKHVYTHVYIYIYTHTRRVPVFLSISLYMCLSFPSASPSLSLPLPPAWKEWLERRQCQKHRATRTRQDALMIMAWIGNAAKHDKRGSRLGKVRKEDNSKVR